MPHLVKASLWWPASAKERSFGSSAIFDARRTAHEVQTPWWFAHKVCSSSSLALSIFRSILPFISALVLSRLADMLTIWDQSSPEYWTIRSRRWNELKIAVGQVSRQSEEARVKRESESIRTTGLVGLAKAYAGGGLSLELNQQGRSSRKVRTSKVTTNLYSCCFPVMP